MDKLTFIFLWGIVVALVIGGIAFYSERKEKHLPKKV